MRITISRPAHGVDEYALSDEYTLGEDGKALAFGTVKEAINYLAARNWTAADLAGLEWHIGGGSGMMDEKERRERDEWMILCMNELLDDYYPEKNNPRWVVDCLADCLVSADRRIPVEGE